MSSILTNTGAMVALQTMKGLNRSMGTVQDQISTGMKVATAKDNSSSWAIATSMRSEVQSFSKLSDSLKSANAMVGVARSAAEQIVENLQLIQEKVVQAQEPGADTVKLQADVDALRDTINSIKDSANYNGINLVAGGDGETIVVSIGVDETGNPEFETFDVAAANLELGEAVITVGGDGALGAINDALDAAIDAAAVFGAAQIRIESQSKFLSAQMDALKIGVGALVDADMEEASARLQALQVQQQLGIQALSVANQQPQNILALFR